MSRTCVFGYNNLLFKTPEHGMLNIVHSLLMELYNVAFGAAQSYDYVCALILLLKATLLQHLSPPYPAEY